MSGFMNIYEPYEPILGVQGLCEKTNVFFFLYHTFLLFLGSFMFICFINFTMRSNKGKFVRQISSVYQYLMNFMNIYEEWVFKGFFENVPYLTGNLMNLKNAPLHKCSLNARRLWHIS